MKKGSLYILSFLLILTLLLTIGCAPAKDNETDESTVFNAESETEAETFIDLSGENAPKLEAPDEEDEFIATASSEGIGQGSDLILSFDGKESNYSFKPYSASANHDAYSCKNCKYEDKNGATAFHLCDHATDHTGILVELKTPVHHSLVSGIQMTFMTSDEITQESQIRILKKDETDTSAIINHSGCPSLSGATEKWKTVDFNMNEGHIRTLADDDGYIRAFQFYFRDKDHTDIYIKNFTFSVSIKQLCSVEAISTNTFSQGEVLNALAQKVAKKLTDSNIGAKIEVKLISYKAPTSQKHGSITFKTIVTPEGGSRITMNARTATVKRMENVWLPLNNEDFGTLRDAKGQWKTQFSKNGIIFLTDNLLQAPEGIARVEYAVIDRELDVTSETVTWHIPQVIELSSDGFAKLYANAFMDYGKSLAEGNEYRFVIRGVTNNNNYILHLDIPFTYNILSEDAASALEKAIAIVKDASLTCPPDEKDKEAHLISELRTQINDQSIAICANTTAAGVNSGKYMISLSYVPSIENNGFFYSLNGEQKNDFYAYTGDFYTVELQVKYTEQTSDIQLVSPYDGETNLRIASAEIVKFWDNDADTVVTSLYEYQTGESCAPVPVRLTWTDKSASDSYTVSVSETDDFQNAWRYTTSETSLDVYSLKAGQRYFWKVESNGKTSATFAFVTEGGYPRYILTEKISNFRDIGGHQTTDGHTVKQGLAFRLSNFDGASAADKQFILNYLGIKSELDLRGEIVKSPLGDTVTPYPISIKWYSGIFAEGESEPLRRAIAVFAKEENYPIGYHCAIGRDRTGTVSILLLGLLGVDEDTILKEYMVSKNSVSGNGDNLTPQALHDNFKSLVNGLDKYGKRDDTFQVKVENYLLSIGITEEEIASIKNIFLED